MVDISQSAALLLFLVTVSSVSGQTFTECNPLTTGAFSIDHGPRCKGLIVGNSLLTLPCWSFLDCQADPAVGKTAVNCDFTKGACDYFEHDAGREVSYDGSRGLVCSMDAPNQAPTITSKKYIFFGRVEIELQAAPGVGLVSTLVLQSDDLDEIDIEILGKDSSCIQTNIFSKGNQTDHRHGAFQAVDDTVGTSHRYTADWTPEKLEWYVDGQLGRTLLRSDVGDLFPQSPMQVKLGAWVAGYHGGDPDRNHWAGGEADFSNGASAAYYRSVQITDYAGGNSATTKDAKEYSYKDHSGSSGSIDIKLKDGSSTTAESSSGGSKSTPESSGSSRADSSEKSSTSAAALKHGITDTTNAAHPTASSTKDGKLTSSTSNATHKESATATPTTSPNGTCTNAATLYIVAFALAVVSLIN